MNTYKRREVLTSLLGLLPIGQWVTKQTQAGAARPNIIYIMADDLGWADLSCYGRREYQTKNLDALAEQGVRFTQAYSASPVCTPTRCAFNTGRYPGRAAIGLKEPLSWEKQVGTTSGLDPVIPTVASLLRSNGYHTALVGKWHLGYLPAFSPLKSGFHEFFGIMSGGVDYFTHKDALGEPDLFEDEVPVEKTGYITDLITHRAIEFVARKHEAPFFLSLNYTAPHWPWEGPEDIDKASVIKSWTSDGGSMQVYGKMVQSMDDGIGRLLAALQKKKLDTNTLIVFTSDNGGERFSYNWPFSGQKFDLLEGGLRVPAIGYWKGKIPKGLVTQQPAITMDWTKTFLAISQTSEHPDYPMDGVDLLPVMTGQQQPFDRTLFWRTRDQGAVRKGTWKYFKKITRVKDCMEESEFLFDLGFDQMEKTNFKEENADMLQELKTAFEGWNNQMLKYE